MLIILENVKAVLQFTAIGLGRDRILHPKKRDRTPSFRLTLSLLLSSLETRRNRYRLNRYYRVSHQLTFPSTQLKVY
ncbi:hypothetical protein [Coleofasciculus sp. E1-EBD-02]|uniref:hypothetical protein n=1 Tax=Coleofasciculus sp. E1-EBD-02 TaxID=3068481 RepID=UPI0032F62AB9